MGMMESAEAADKLRAALQDARVRKRLSVIQLAGLSGLGRTTVSAALSDNKPVPTAQTVAALARALHLDAAALLELQRAASTPQATATAPSPGPGVPIRQCNPLDLDVHPAGYGPGRDASLHLSGYVRREHDRKLASVVRQASDGHSEMAVLIGSSSTGKTRACWEAVQPLADLGWRLWHPFDPTLAHAALAGINMVGPRTVVWLNEAQHYLNAGEQLASALHALLTDPARGPVLVLGTLWLEYDLAYTAPPRTGQPDRYAAARKLLAGRRISVPEYFDPDALLEAKRLADGGDLLLARALTSALEGRVTQHLAGAPELLRRYENASPAAKALLHAAVDARRLGAGLHLPLGFLAEAATDYLHPEEWDSLDEDWLEQALAQLAEPVHGSLAPLREVRPRPRHNPPATEPAVARETDAAPGPLYRLADYLEQHGRRERWALCPPDTFWHAAHAHLADPDALHRLGSAGWHRHRLQWAAALFAKAADAGDTAALSDLALMLDSAGDQQGAGTLWQRAADAGNHYALYRLAQMRGEAGDWHGAETLHQRAAESGDISAPRRLAEMLRRAGHGKRADALLRRAADAGNFPVLHELAEMREQAGDWHGAEMFYRRAADVGSTYALAGVAWMREKAGNQEEAERLYRRAADAHVLTTFIGMRIELSEDPQRAHELYELAADAGDRWALYKVAEMRELAGNHQEAMELIERAADARDARALTRLARMREQTGDWRGAETLYLRAADNEESNALTSLVEMHEKARGRWDYETVSRRVADAEWNIFMSLAEMRDSAGDEPGADDLARRSADAGDTEPLIAIAHARSQDGDPVAASVLRYGLNPDGTPSQPW